MELFNNSLIRDRELGDKEQEQVLDGKELGQGDKEQVQDGRTQDQRNLPQYDTWHWSRDHRFQDTH